MSLIKLKHNMQGALHEFLSGASDSSRASESQRVSSSTSNSDRTKSMQKQSINKLPTTSGGMWDWNTGAEIAKNFFDQKSEPSTSRVDDNWEEKEPESSLNTHCFTAPPQNEVCLVKFIHF